MIKNFFIVVFSLLIASGNAEINLSHDCCSKQSVDHCKTKCIDTCCFEEGVIVIAKGDLHIPIRDNEINFIPLNNRESDYFNSNPGLKFFSKLQNSVFKELQLFKTNRQALYGNFIFYG